MTWYYMQHVINSLDPGRSGCDSKNGIFNLVLLIGIFRSSHDDALQWMPQDLTDDKSKLVQVMAWCRQARSHYLSQCWPRSISPYGITRPQWVNKDKMLVQLWTNKWHPISHLHRWAEGYHSWVLWRKITMIYEEYIIITYTLLIMKCTTLTPLAHYDNPGAYFLSLSLHSKCRL